MRRSRWSGSTASVPPAGRAFSPLDEELELGPETFDPWIVESIVLLGTVMPFERVPLVVDRLLTLPVSIETARRLTEAIGATRVALEDAEAEDRKSTRLNSSHVEISYAVFCLKKKT